MEHVNRAEAVRKVRVAKKQYAENVKSRADNKEAYLLSSQERKKHRDIEKLKIDELKTRGEKWTYAHPEYKELQNSPAHSKSKDTYKRLGDEMSRLRKEGPSSGVEAHAISVDDKMVKFGRNQGKYSNLNMEDRGKKKIILSEAGVTPDAHIVKTSKGTYLVADKMDVDRDKIREIPEWEKAGLSRKAKEYGAPIDDLHRGNFGIDPEGKPKIIDAGFNRFERPPTPDMDDKIIKRTISGKGNAFRQLSKLSKHLPMIGALSTAYSALTSPSVEAGTEEVLSEFDPFGIALPDKVNVGDDAPYGGVPESEMRQRYLESLKNTKDK